MVWRIEFVEAAKKEMAQLDRQSQTRILRYIRERLATEEAPRRYGRPLRGNLAGLWKYRLGDYRIIAEVQDDRVLVLVLRVGHRRYVYGGH